MSRNYVEDNLIHEIDLQSGGLDLESAQIEFAARNRCLNLWFDTLESAVEVAETYPGFTDLVLAAQNASVIMLESRISIELTTLIRSSGLSRRKIRNLLPTNSLRQSFEELETKLKDLGRRRESMEACLLARRYLKEQNTLIRLYILYRRRHGADLSIELLKQRYPDVYETWGN